MKKILVTGSTGFIGNNCLPILSARKDFEIHAVSSKPYRGDCSDVHWHQADLMDSKQTLELFSRVQPSHLLHFAWYTVPGKYWNSTENFRWVQASLTLLEAFSNNGGKRIVMAGTCAEYDWEHGYLSEKTTPLLPDTVYGKCKHSLQVMLDAFCKQADISCAWGRIFFLYGPNEHQDKLIPSVIRSLIQDRSARCTHGNQIRDYLYVEDVAEAFIALLESEVQGPVNIASGSPVSLKEIIYKISEKLNREDLINLGAIPASKNEPHLLVADVRRLSEEVGWSPKYDLNAGLDNTIDWWKKQ